MQLALELEQLLVVVPTTTMVLLQKVRKAQVFAQLQDSTLAMLQDLALVLVPTTESVRQDDLGRSLL